LQVLLVEDEEHKIRDLQPRLARLPEHGLTVARSVRDAVLAVFERRFDLAILDMALPTFAKIKSAESGGVAQAAGGVEVLRALQEAGQTAQVIVVTQYPDIFISGRQIKLHMIKKTLEQRYQQKILGVVLYSYDSEDWSGAFDSCLGRVS